MSCNTLTSTNDSLPSPHSALAAYPYDSSLPCESYLSEGQGAHTSSVRVDFTQRPAISPDSAISIMDTNPSRKNSCFTASSPSATPNHSFFPSSECSAMWKTFSIAYVMPR